jgi:uncharacterized protein DUF5994
MAPHVTARTRVTDRTSALSPAIPPASRLSLDPGLNRRGALDGGWWPRSRDASVELPGLVSALNARVGAIVRLGVDARDWDDIPRRITVAGHVVRIGRFADVNHKIIATRGPQDHLLLLVVPPRASTAAAKSALAMAARGKNAGRPEEILVASGIANEAGTNPPRALPEEDAPPEERRFAGAPALMAEEVPRDEIGRWCDDGAPVHAPS